MRQKFAKAMVAVVLGLTLLTVLSGRNRMSDIEEEAEMER